MSNVVQLNVNGTVHRLELDPDTSLLSVLREDLGLTGSKYGCGEGQCGACTVLLDGVPRRSCITPAGAATNKQITTIEGLGKNGELHALQQAFLKVGALQCGYCTSGMIVTAAGLLRTNPNPTEADVAHFLQGNICRCGTYRRIIAAVRLGAKLAKEAQR